MFVTIKLNHDLSIEEVRVAIEVCKWIATDESLLAGDKDRPINHRGQRLGTLVVRGED